MVTRKRCFSVLDVEVFGRLLRVEVLEARPERLLRRLGRVVVEALAVLAAAPVEVVDQLVDQRHVAGIDGGLAEIGDRGLQDLLGEVDRHFVVERQRADRHAGHLGGILDHRRRHAFDQHVIGFVDIAEDAAVDVEAARVVDDDRRLLDRGDEIERHGQRLVAGLLAEDDFRQHHLLDRREEVDADELGRALRVLRKAGDRQGRGVGGEDGVFGSTASTFSITSFLTCAVLEHGLDDELDVLQVVIIGRRGDAARAAPSPRPASAVPYRSNP